MTERDPAAASAPPVSEGAADASSIAVDARRARRLQALALTALLCAWRSLSYAMSRLSTTSNDFDLQFYLSRLTAQGELPFRDFEHGWNAGTWYVGAALYYLTGGNQYIWLQVWGVVIPAVATGAVGYLWLRRRGVGGLAGAVTVTAVMALVPAQNAKYALPILALVVLDESRRRWPEWFPLSVGVTLAVLVVLQVEIAIMLLGAVGLFTAITSRLDGDRWRRTVRDTTVVLAAGVGAIMVALALEAGLFRLAGLGFQSFLDQALFDQGDVHEEQYGWSLFMPPGALAGIAVLLVGVPLVPGVLRRTGAAARLAACASLAILVIGIRRTDPAHFQVALNLAPFALVLAFHDLSTSGLRLPRARDLPVRPAVVAGLATLAAVGVFEVGLAVASLGGVLLAVGGVAIAVIVAVGLRSADRPVSIVGPVVALGLVAVVGFGSYLVDRATDPTPVERFGERRDLVNRALDQCPVQSDDVWIIPGPLMLYHWAEVENPTPYYRFQYDFSDNRADIEGRLADGSVPLVLALGDFTADTNFMVDLLAETHELCALVPDSEIGAAYVFADRELLADAR
jgi:hypothetical protein